MAQDPPKSPEEELVEVKAELQVTKDTLATKEIELQQEKNVRLVETQVKTEALDDLSKMRARIADYDAVKALLAAAQAATATLTIQAARVAPLQADLATAESERDAARQGKHEAIVDGIIKEADRDAIFQRHSALEVAASKLVEAFVYNEDLGPHLIALTALLPEHGQLDPQVLVKVNPPPPEPPVVGWNDQPL